MKETVLVRPVLRSEAEQPPQEKPTAPEGVWRWAWALVVPALVAIYLLVNLRFPLVLPGGLNIYLAQPAAWTGLALLALLGWRYGLRAKPTAHPRFLALAALLGAFPVSLTGIAGLTFGFGYSPYGHQAEVLAGNLIYVATMLGGIELSRALLIGVVGRSRPLAGLLLVSLLFTTISVSLGQYRGLTTPLSVFKMGGETFLPLMAQNLLATLLAMLGGPLASIAYRGVLEGFEWTSPILPNLGWAITALVGTLAPVIGMLVVQAHAREPSAPAERRASRWPSAWLVPAFLGVLMIWFNQGLFGVRPTIVSGVSMNPMLQAGDLVLTVDVAPEEIAVGDIVRFRSGQVDILHRVVEIRDAGGLEFITRGDANNVTDPPLPASAVEGRVVKILPGLGWPSIGVRLGLQWVLDRVAS